VFRNGIDTFDVFVQDFVNMAAALLLARIVTIFLN